MSKNRKRRSRNGIVWLLLLICIMVGVGSKWVSSARDKARSDKNFIETSTNHLSISVHSENTEISQTEQTVTVESVTLETNTLESDKTSHQMIEKIVDEMSLEEKVGQLFFVRVPYSNQVEDIQTYHLGGYLLFGVDFEGQTLDSVKANITSYQEASKVPLIIGSDEEGGTVTRVSQLLDTPFKAPLTIYQESGLSGLKKDAINKTTLLRELGIQTGLFPDADVATDPAAFIYDRTIGEDAKTTAKYVEEMVTTLSDQQFGSVLKHFPGYGNNRDSHVEIVYDNRPLDELRKNDFLPFEAGIKAGADAILVSHNIVTSIDDVPSSISPKINKIIREELVFDGVVMTDDLAMQGLSLFTSQEAGAFAAIEAGNDLVISSDYRLQIPYIIDQVNKEAMSIATIDQAVKRVLIWKEKLGLLENYY